MPDPQRQYWVLKDLLDRTLLSFRPKQYKALEKSGQLTQKLHRDATYGWKMMKQLRDQGLQEHEAEELILADLYPISEEQEAEQARESQEPDLMEDWLKSKQSIVVRKPDGRTWDLEDLDAKGNPLPDAESANWHMFPEEQQKNSSN